MNKQELLQKVREKNPKYANLNDDVLLNVVLKQKPALKNELTDYTEQKTIQKPAETPKKEVKSEEQHPLSRYLTGFAKGAGRSVVDLGKFIAGSNPIPAALGLGKEYKEYIDKTTSDLESKLEPKTSEEKIGGYIETAAELALPSGLIAKATKAPREISKAKSALTLSTKELSKISSNQFKKIFGVDKKELETVGGIIKSETKKMPEKVKDLAKEFADILQGNPSENLNKAKSLGKDYWNKTIDLFEGDNRLINEKTIRNHLKKTIEEGIAFDSPFQKKEILDKTIEPFMKNLKSGTLKGLEEARAKMSSAGRDATGKLKPALDSLHNAVKEIIKENLPEEKKLLYDIYKTKMAKLFDVREVLKAKNAIVSDTSLLKKAGKAVVGTGLLAGAVEGARRLLK